MKTQCGQPLNQTGLENQPGLSITNDPNLDIEIELDLDGSLKLIKKTDECYYSEYNFES